MMTMRRSLIATTVIAGMALTGIARTEQIVVSNYGIAANGMPYAVAMEKGFFKQEGADVTGILSSNGGGTTIRNLLGGNLDYGEVDLAGTVAAIERGSDLHIISDNVLTVGEFVWAVKPDSPIRSLADFKGHKIGYTNPRSTSQALNILLVQTIGLTQADVDPIKVGGFGEQVVALDIGAIDVATLADPVWSKNSAKLRTVVRGADALPPLCNVIGVATGKAIAEHGDFLRALLRARRKAVEFMYANPDEAGDVVARVYDLDPAIARQAVRNLTTMAAGATRPYWGTGRFDIKGMDAMIAAQRSVGAYSGTPDWEKMIDRSFLAEDLKKDYE
jgi:NitT/TauT family transport system substrate-binding protein